MGLLDTAMRQNLDVRIAVQRVEVYQAQYLARRGALFPTVSAGGTTGLDHYGLYTMTGVGNFDTNLSQNIEGGQRIPTGLTPDYFAGLRSSWKIDIWGKLRSRRQAAQALHTQSLAFETRQRIIETETRLNQLPGCYPQAIRRPPAPDAGATRQHSGGRARYCPAAPPRRAPGQLELRATHADVAAARAAFLPSLTLTPFLGLNSFQRQPVFQS